MTGNSRVIASGDLAPVVLFVYKRPDHTRRTIEALKDNDLAADTHLFVYSDGPKRPTDEPEVEEVRRLVAGISGFKSVTVIERAQNMGLADSVISGVSAVLETSDKVIVVEDDLVTSSEFLRFMNTALRAYETETNIFSVAGYNFPIEPPTNYRYDAFCSYRSLSWGWGTWRDRWEKADWHVRDFDRFIRDKTRRGLFNRGGEDLTDILRQQMVGRVDSWSIRWDYTHFKNDAYALLPVRSMVYNIGFDGSGVHCGARSPAQAGLTENLRTRDTAYRLPPIHLEPHFIDAIYALHRQTLTRKAKKVIRSLLRRR